ncbi:hypothetical protein J2T15_004331 [Paenibacillus harenae]|uniref:Uncharacterized protein n=1 Tax=Paenibacillus harenae TaxID=306543 RepID=A0ABT9U5F6_PAEHA|nr:hypothetical protein [Paenibacillus harenae]
MKPFGLTFLMIPKNTSAYAQILMNKIDPVALNRTEKSRKIFFGTFLCV